MPFYKTFLFRFPFRKIAPWRSVALAAVIASYIQFVGRVSNLGAVKREAWSETEFARVLIELLYRRIHIIRTAFVLTPGKYDRITKSNIIGTTPRLRFRETKFVDAIHMTGENNRVH